jgi:hypothetical protein
MTTFDAITSISNAVQTAGYRLSSIALDGDTLPETAVDKSFCILMPEQSGTDSEDDRRSTDKSPMVDIDTQLSVLVIHKVANQSPISTLEKTAEALDKIVKGILKVSNAGSIHKILFIGCSSVIKGDFITQTIRFKVSYFITNF